VLTHFGLGLFWIRAVDTLNELLTAGSFSRYLEIVFRYVLQVFDIPKEELGQLVTRAVKPDVKEFIMTTYEQLKEEGRREGEQKGKQEGANSVLAQLVAKKFRADPEDLVPLIEKLSGAQQEELIERVFGIAKP